MTGRVRDYVYRDEEGRPLRTRDVQAMAARFTPLDKARLQAGQKSAWSTDAGSVADSIPPTADFFGDRARDSESEVSEGGDEDDDPTQRGLSPRDGLIGQGAKSLPQPAPVAVHKQPEFLHPAQSKSQTPPRKAINRYHEAVSGRPIAHATAYADRSPIYTLKDQRSEKVAGMFGSDLGSDRTAESAPVPVEGVITSVITNSSKYEPELDYSTEQLQNMAYEDLKTEPFDKNPRGSGPVVPDTISSEPLSTKVEHIAKYAENDHDHALKLCNFFSSLTIDQYETYGDEIIEHFQKIMTRFRELRQEKRQVANQFEEEVAEREEAVTQRKGFLEDDLARLKKQGQDVIQGKP